MCMIHKVHTTRIHTASFCVWLHKKKRRKDERTTEPNQEHSDQQASPFPPVIFRVINFVPHYSLTHSLHAAVLEKLTGLQLVKKIPTFYGTRRFITVFASARHLYLSRASSIQSKPPYPTFWRSFPIISPFYAWVFQMVFFPQDSKPKPFSHPSSPPYVLYTLPILFFSIWSQKLLGEEYRSLSPSLCSFLHSPVTSFLLDPNILLNTLFSNTLRIRSSLNFNTKFHTHTKQQAKL